MIYQLKIRLQKGNASHGRTEITLYAHPAWPFVMGSDGDPENDFTVLFVREPRDDLGVEVYRRVELGRAFNMAGLGKTPERIHQKVIPYADHREEHDQLMEVIMVDDMTLLG